MRLTGRSVAVLLAAVVLAWGVNWTVTKIIVSMMPPIWATAVRAAIATVALLALQTAGRTLIIPKMRDLPAVCIVAIFHMVLFAVLMAIGLQYISVGRSVVLAYTTPLWVAPFSRLFLKEPMPPVKVLGILIGLAGLAVLLNPMALDWNDRHALIGSGILLCAALSWAVSIVCVRAITWHSTPFQLVPWQNLLAALIMTGVALAVEGPLHITPTWELSVAMAYNALVATAFGFWAITVVNTYYSATTTSLALLATPIVGAVSSLIMIGEAIDLPLVVAGAMILLGIAFGTMGKSGK
ncbi:conserved membrane hypothetical protein [uncultured delta proteobacterium]|uniref:EamA domain-containing protein n=1 Tax=uncultured delta proteobacterium TaxID=34034 RepID=A0A212KCM8_9DELT|nr:conserved membrane hypothetical protein [uncultured delta proteobacterium]